MKVKPKLGQAHTPRDTSVQMPVREICHVYEKRCESHVYDLGKGPIKASMIIPFFRAGFIGWVPFEALIRQQGIDFSWELLVMEEDFDNPFTLSRIMDYASSLRQIECARIIYLSLLEWIPLSAKYYFMLQHRAATSKVILFNSADNYFSQHRFKKQYRALKDNKHNWYKILGNVTMDIKSGKHAKRINMDRERSDTSGKAMHVSLASRIPLASFRRGVDGFLKRSLTQAGSPLRIYCDTSDMWKETVNIAGLNTLSKSQGSRVKNLTAPLQYCCDSLENHLPSDIVKRLSACASHLGAHTKLSNTSKIRL